METTIRDGEDPSLSDPTPGTTKPPAAPISLVVVVTVIVAAVIGLYAHTLNRPFVWDDGLQISDNPAVTRGAPVLSYFADPSTTTASSEYNSRVYRPLRNLTFRLVATVGGIRPAAFHVANLLLYLASIPLVLLLVLRSSGDRLAAAFAASLWAVQPVHVEPVVYASALGDLLSLVLELAALLAALAALGGSENPAAARTRGLAAGSVVLMLAAMLAKEMAVTGVALLGLWVLWQRPRSRLALPLLGAHVLAVAGYVVLRTAVLGRVGQEAVTPSSVLLGLREAPVLLVAYARVTLAPLGHNTAYFETHPGLVGFLGVLGAIAGAFAAATAIDRRWPQPPGVRLGLCWFVVTLLPVLNIVPIWAHVADRFALVPSVGVALMAGWSVARIPAPRRRRAALALGMPILLLYGAGTLVEQRAWRSDLHLWRHATVQSPGSGMARFNLARAHMSLGQFEPALVQIDKILGPHPDVPRVAWLWRAIALDALERRAEALSAAAKAVEHLSDSVSAHALLGELLLTHGDRAAAKAAWRRAQALAPSHTSTRLLDAAILAHEGQTVAAAARYKEIAVSSPDVARFRFLAARSAIDAGDLASAAAQAGECLRIEPQHGECAALLARSRGVAPR